MIKHEFPGLTCWTESSEQDFQSSGFVILLTRLGVKSACHLLGVVHREKSLGGLAKVFFFLICCVSSIRNLHCGSQNVLKAGPRVNQRQNTLVFSYEQPQTF